jgi:hypothetical protein
MAKKSDKSGTPPGTVAKRRKQVLAAMAKPPAKGKATPPAKHLVTETGHKAIEIGKFTVLPVVKRSPGRPTSYRPEFCELAVAMGRNGQSRAQIAAGLGVRRQTIANWEEQFAEFLDAMTEANDLSLAWFENLGQRGMASKSFNAPMWGLQVRNRFRADYGDKQQLELSGPGGKPIEHKQVDTTVEDGLALLAKRAEALAAALAQAQPADTAEEPA